MFARWSLRVRIFLFFALIVAAGGAAIGGGLWLGYARVGIPEALPGFVIGGLVSVFGLAGIALWIWLLFDENVAKPVGRLAADLRARTHADVEGAVEHGPARHLGDLGPAAAAVAENLVASRNALAEAVARETQRIAHQNLLLERSLRDMPASVVICTTAHRIALYNDLTARLFADEEILGLDRPIFDLLAEAPLRHAYARLIARPEEDRSVDLLCPTRDGRIILTGQMRLMPSLEGEETKPGYMLTLRDATRELKSGFALNLMLGRSLEQVRRPAANLQSVVSALEAAGDLPPEQSAAFRQALGAEVERLGRAVSDLSRRQEMLTPEWWPLADATVSDLFGALGGRATPGAASADSAAPGWLRLDPPSPDLVLRCDSFSLLLLISGLTDLLRRRRGAAITVAARAESPGALIEIAADGVDLTPTELETWLAEPLADETFQCTGEDVLLRHGTEIWPERSGASGTRLCLPIREARPVGDRPAGARAAGRRAEFYDFSLLDAGAPGAADDRPLGDLQYVVFDTETTGLLPDEGDELVQIAAVRIVNGRMLMGERFDTLVNPGRPIPARSTEVHGISEAMVVGAPTVLEAVERFHRFCGDGLSQTILHEFSDNTGESPQEWGRLEKEGC